jgi:uncharacterized protein (DUF488 family)
VSGWVADDVTAPVIYTLGHSRHGIDVFIALAKQHGVETIVDVRGQPWSRYNPQFNQDAVAAAVEQAGLSYRWEGERLSGRPKDRRFYDAQGKVDWDALRHWPALAEGLNEIRALAEASTLALVCAEEDPLHCHRRGLLTGPPIDRGVAVLHIHKDGIIETEEEVAVRARGADPRQIDLFG